MRDILRIGSKGLGDRLDMGVTGRDDLYDTWECTDPGDWGGGGHR